MIDRVPLAVFDCQLYLQTAIRGTGPAAACFDLVEQGRVRLAVSNAVLREVREVLSRPKLLRKYPQLGFPSVADFLDAVVERAELVDPVPRLFTYTRDPKDEPYLDLAIASGSQYLVSRDQDLLDLQDAASIAGEELRALAPQLRVIDPIELLRELGAAGGEPGTAF